MGMTSHELRIEHARIYATAAHAAVGQKRKYSGEPYIVHPAEVARLVQSIPHITEMAMAAWLHDVVEDTQATIEQIRQEFGDMVARYVEGLTNVAGPSDGNHSERFKVNCLHLAAQPAEVQTIKIADMIANTTSVVQHDRAFAATYLREKWQVLLLLTKGDSTLTQLAWKTVKHGLHELEQIA